MIFSENDQTLCASVNITDDKKKEGFEDFSIELHTPIREANQPRGPQLSTSMLQLFIRDDISDGKNVSGNT